MKRLVIAMLAAGLTSPVAFAQEAGEQGGTGDGGSTMVGKTVSIIAAVGSLAGVIAVAAGDDAEDGNTTTTTTTTTTTGG